MARRLHKLLCAALVSLLIASLLISALAESVTVKVNSSSAHFYKSASSSSASLRIKKGTKLTVTAVKNGWAKVSCKGKTGYMKTSDLARVKKKKSSSWKSKVKVMKWFEGGSEVLGIGSYGYIYDIWSGKTIRIKRMGGSSHADVEPATKKDTKKLYALGYSWESRPVVLLADGKYVACAINTMPHGDQTISTNGYNGQFCLHMLGSKTHGTDRINEEHQYSVKEAYEWAH